MSRTVRMGVVGLGSMGTRYAKLLQEGGVERAVLGAVCNRGPGPRDAFASVPGFAEVGAMLRSGAVDAVLIATPHYAHPPVAIAALRHGIHVLVDKPIAVDKAAAERMLAAHAKSDAVFAVMFQMRTDPKFRCVKDLLDAGTLGRLQRVQWTLTDWFRTDAYYRSSAWRATWRGEGGGVLLNQAPHQLDLLQWFAGMPVRLRAWCRFGRHHAIEVEDEVTAYLEYAEGATGVFIASTGEAPGTNRLEIAGDRARLVLEGGRLTLDTNEVPARELSAQSPELFVTPKFRREESLFAPVADLHLAVMRNFVDAILDGAPLIAPAAEGLHSLELANAMVLSTVTAGPVDLPIGGRRYKRVLDRLCAGGAR